MVIGGGLQSGLVRAIKARLTFFFAVCWYRALPRNLIRLERMETDNIGVDYHVGQDIGDEIAFSKLKSVILMLNSLENRPFTNGHYLQLI